jgi:SAM-dependent methyltransferase
VRPSPPATTEPRSDSSGAQPQVQVNEALWAGEDLVRHYAGRSLRPAEVMLLVRHREALGGRVLELGCGGGRLSGYLDELARDFRGLDISPLMVEHCARMYPGGTFELGDLRDLSRYGDGSLDVVFASFNVLDVLDQSERLRVLGELHRIIAPAGLLIMSSHNLAHAPLIPKPSRLSSRDPIRIARQLISLPRRERNRRRLIPLQRVCEDHAILTDEAHEYGILHYYIGRDAQQRQLAQAGFELLECLDLDGREVPPGAQAASHPELHYVARKVTRGSSGAR